MTRVKSLVAFGTVLLLIAGVQSVAQPAPDSLEDYLAQTVAELSHLSALTIGEWAARHPGETVEWPEEPVKKPYPDNPRDEDDARVSIPRQSRGPYGCWPLKGAFSQPLKSKSKSNSKNLARRALVETPTTFREKQTPGNVKLLLPPRQSRGASHV